MLISFTSKGLYCEQADVYIDPWKPVDRALITHAHADHARPGMKHYLSHRINEPILRHRLGDSISIQGVNYGETLNIHGVSISFHPAGHIIGSCQIRLEFGSEVWVISGDYKTAPDGFSDPFEPVSCTHFITESTFGLPVFRFPDEQEVANSINSWWHHNREQGKASLLLGYSLGKAQRLCRMLKTDNGPVYLHGAIHAMNQVLLENGHDLPRFPLLDDSVTKSDLKGAMVIAPPGASGSAWTKRLPPFAEGMASGWMNIRGMRRRRAADRGFVLSDHADWDGLNEAIAATGAEHVFVTHGYADTFTQFLKDQGYDAHVVSTEFGEPE